MEVLKSIKSNMTVLYLHWMSEKRKRWKHVILRNFNFLWVQECGVQQHPEMLNLFSKSLGNHRRLIWQRWQNQKQEHALCSLCRILCTCAGNSSLSAVTIETPPSPVEKPLTARFTVSLLSNGVTHTAQESVQGTEQLSGDHRSGRSRCCALGYASGPLAAVALCWLACQFSPFVGADDWNGVTSNSDGTMRNWNEFTWEAAARRPGANCRR